MAASLPRIPSLTRLNLAFNDIGCRGMATLMRALVGCESITSLGLSGIAMRISGAIAMGFTLATSSSFHSRASQLLSEPGGTVSHCCRDHIQSLGAHESHTWFPSRSAHGRHRGVGSCCSAHD